MHIWHSNICQITKFRSIILKCDDVMMLCMPTQRIFHFHSWNPTIRASSKVWVAAKFTMF